MTYAQMYDTIPVGAHNAISRAELAELWQVSDRTVRDLIHNLREMRNRQLEQFPLAILSNSSGDKADRGYWRSDNAEEVARYNREVESRARQVIRAWQRIPVEWY